VDELCRLVCERRSYVEDRLLLIGGDPDVFAALGDHLIGIGVAKELNKVKGRAGRMNLLEMAVIAGATVEWARKHRIECNAMDDYQQSSPAPDQLARVTLQLLDQKPGMVCLLCDSAEDPHEMEIVYIHKSCRRVNERRAAAGAAGEGGSQ
jgi:hypothetical protein